jgi:hypothetical protein
MRGLENAYLLRLVDRSRYQRNRDPSVAPLRPIQLLHRVILPGIDGEAIQCVGWIRDDAAVLKAFGGLLEDERVGRGRVDRKPDDVTPPRWRAAPSAWRWT